MARVRRQHGQGVIYLLHFRVPYKHAAHYLGWTESLEQRLAEHGKGRGARLLAVVKEAGGEWELVRTWEGDRHLERRLKKRGGKSRLCPICQGRKRAMCVKASGEQDAPLGA